jgi:HPt (histidine-containing phosphotransfer) domain-containing protein
MGTSRNDAPAVTSYSDYEVIVPPNRLRKAVTHVRAGLAGEDPVARAEAALAGLAHEFSAWMDAECDRLDRARRTVVKSGLSGAGRDELFHAAHDIRGEAETFGYPQAGYVADSLCRLIEFSPKPDVIPLPLIAQHVDAIRAIIRETKAGGAEDKAGVLAQRLRQVTDDFLAHANRDHPNALDGVIAPPLAP